MLVRATSCFERARSTTQTTTTATATSPSPSETATSPSPSPRGTEKAITRSRTILHGNMRIQKGRARDFRGKHAMSFFETIMLLLPCHRNTLTLVAFADEKGGASKATQLKKSGGWEAFEDGFAVNVRQQVRQHMLRPCVGDPHAFLSA